MSEDFMEMEERQRTELDALRDMVKLNPFDYFRVQRARRQAEKFRDLYIKENPSDIIGVDYTIADDLEHSLRFRALERRVEKSWRDYLKVERDGYGLNDYARDVLNEFMKSKDNQNGRSR